MLKTICSRNRDDLEVITVQNLWFEDSYKSHSLLLCMVYRPLSSPVSFWDDLNLSIERALDVNQNVIVLGDLIGNRLNDNLVQLRNLLFINNLENVKNELTRTTQQTSTHLFLISKNLHTHDAGCIDVDGPISDHRASILHLKYYNKPVELNSLE